MTLEKAEDLSKTQNKVTAVNEVLMNAAIIFNFEKLEQELDELMDDARDHGISFCTKCGWASTGPCKCKESNQFF